MSFVFDPLTELRLDISSDLHHQCWSDAQSVSFPNEQWNRYLNQVCLQTVLPWLQEEQDQNAMAGATPPTDWLRGTAIALGNQRVVLVPSQTLDTREFRVPQEWLDIPDWAGNYFLAVQIDPDDLVLRVWGYTTHQTLKTKGNLDSHDRAYCLDADFLVQDLNVLWVVRHLNPDEPTQTAIAPISALSATQAATLLAQLTAVDGQPVRLAAPFTEWAAFLQNANLRQQLAQNRRRQNQPPESATDTSTADTTVQLGDWLQNQVAAGWQTLESLFGDRPDLAYSLRKTPSSDNMAVRRVRRVNLPEHDVLLVVEVEPDEGDRVGVRVQLRPLDSTVLLPPSLSLSLLTPDGETIQIVQAREQDNLIQLKRFRCTPDTEFSLQIAIANQTVTIDVYSRKKQ